MTPRAWALLLVPLFVPLAVGYVLRLTFGGLAAGAGFVAGNLRWLAMPFAYTLKRAKGFHRIHGAWVKPRAPNVRHVSAGAYRYTNGRRP